MAVQRPSRETRRLDMICNTSTHCGMVEAKAFQVQAVMDSMNLDFKWCRRDYPICFKLEERDGVMVGMGGGTKDAVMRGKTGK